MTDRQKLELNSLLPQELEALAKAEGWPAFRGRQIFRWLQEKGVERFAEMTNLPQSLRERLEQIAAITTLRPLARYDAAAGDTHKLLLELYDGERIETALMLYHKQASRDRATCCISSQSGCRMGCAFCATGLIPEGRNLSAGEIVRQVQRMVPLAQEAGFAGVTNVVFMGMGEPLLNLENVHRALLLLNHAEGLHIGMRRMTISTCGIVPKIEEMAGWGLQVGLAVSLHAPTDALRDRLMPINRKYPLATLLPACRAYAKASGQKITYEYALFAGINDGPKNAHLLAKLLAAENCLINIIPANPVAETGFSPPEVEEIEDFCRIVASYGLEVQRREERGRDIEAACGQLRRRTLE